MRKTKIICTIGPACNNEETLTKMCLAGMNVARLNFSHGSCEEQMANIQLVKKVREKLGLPIAILLDTKGPEYRIGRFKKGKIQLEAGDSFTFTTNDVVGDSKCVSVSYKELTQELCAGDRILLNNGLMMFEVESVDERNVYCKTVIGGELSDRKSMSFPGKVLKQKYLSEYNLGL